MVSEVDYSPLPKPKILIQYYRILENKKSNVILHMSDSDNIPEEVNVESEPEPEPEPVVEKNPSIKLTPQQQKIINERNKRGAFRKMSFGI